MRSTLEQQSPGERLTKEEQERNRFGDPIEFIYNSSAEFVGYNFPSCNLGIGLPNLSNCRTFARSRSDMLYDRTDIEFRAEVKRGETECGRKRAKILNVNEGGSSGTFVTYAPLCSLLTNMKMNINDCRCL